ncbi:MarR family transcriptional regulator [Corynebacterium sp. LK2590]|uniref:MarR family transcriptional regulator n=1 Tax=unclassified Corynebacterium TaxID=2624378 RepID=UPI0034CE14A4
MLAVHARYRGSSMHRADLVKRSAQALATLDGVDDFTILGVEDICTVVDSPSSVCEVVMALLADGDWAVGIGLCPGATDKAVARATASGALGRSARAGQVRAKTDVRARKSEADDIAAAFGLLGYVLHKRTAEGREATSLVRSGYNQNEAAEQLGISKQAMSQRLQAAGWAAESAGWQLAVRLLERGNQA